MVLCGKGGVGKTTLSLAIGLKHANEGKRVVIVSSHPLPELAIAVSLEGLGRNFPVAARNLFVVHLDSKELLTEVVEKHFPVPMLARTVLNSSLFENLIAISPGLKEFYFLARLQQLAERRKAAQGSEVPDYDYLIWDAPASGHFLSTLRAARAFERFLSGPLAAAGAELDRFFSNSATMQILAVTPLEEMAIAETVEMTQALKADFGLRCTALIINLVSPLLSATEAQVAGLKRAADESAAFRFAMERGRTERERNAEIGASIDALQIHIPRIRHWDGDLDLLGQVGQFVPEHFSQVKP